MLDLGDADAETVRFSVPPELLHLAHERDERGVYPCPFGFAVNVPLLRSDRLVPVVADDAAALAPLADALSLVRASGGFDARRLRVPTAEIRFIFARVPDRARATRRLRQLARDLLALGQGVDPDPPGLDFQPALELRCPEPQALSVHLYVEGTSSLHETRLAELAHRLEPMLASLIEARPHVETPFVLRRRVLARCNVDLDHLFASLTERERDRLRERRAVQQALHWLAAAHREPVLAVAQNELVLSNVARVARALDDDGRRSTAEGHCHAARFGAAAPLASFAAAGPLLVGALELPLALDVRRRTSLDAVLAAGLMRGESIEDVGVLSTCLGLAAQLASVKAAISLALTGALPVRPSAPPPVSVSRPARERRSSTPPPLADVERSALDTRSAPTPPAPSPAKIPRARPPAANGVRAPAASASKLPAWATLSSIEASSERARAAKASGGASAVRPRVSIPMPSRPEPAAPDRASTAARTTAPAALAVAPARREKRRAPAAAAARDGASEEGWRLLRAPIREASSERAVAPASGPRAAQPVVAASSARPASPARRSTPVPVDALHPTIQPVLPPARRRSREDSGIRPAISPGQASASRQASSASRQASSASRQASSASR
ncbi:MAG TPA: hypothetical protein VMG12_04230, partial [Polyangiaceae bacterium]|nr:hypothetical protein [Polyangiaceae bacterium]